MKSGGCVVFVLCILRIRYTYMSVYRVGSKIDNPNLAFFWCCVARLEAQAACGGAAVRRTRQK